MRHNVDKEIEVVDLDQLFSEYVETDLLQRTNATAHPPSSDDLAHLFELDSSNGNEALKTSPMPDWDICTEDAWHKAVHKLEQNLASPTTSNTPYSIYPHSQGKAAQSDPELLYLDRILELDIVEPRPRSQPCTPRPHWVRPEQKTISIPDRSIRLGVHKTLRRTPGNSNLAAKMMQQAHYRPGVPDLFTRRMDNTTDPFGLDLPPSGLQSPLPSTRFAQSENLNGCLAQDQQPYPIAVSPLPCNDATTPALEHSNYQLTPLSSPAVDTSSSHNFNSSQLQFSSDSVGSAYTGHHAALSALQTPPASQSLPMTAWGADASPSLDFSSYPASPDYASHNAKGSGWWGSSAPLTQPSTSSTYHAHSRSASQNMSFTAASVAGLGISCDTLTFSGFDAEIGAPSSQIGGLAGPSSGSFDMVPYTPLYPQPPPTPTPGIPIGHGPANSGSRSPSPDKPHFTRRRHSGHVHQHQSSSTRRERRKSSNSSNQSHPRSTSSASVGFVNFTPDDSKKILTGVAPSGSSKTKARREKEAAEKRRKLSQAAVKAVMEAGGDIARLEEEGLLVLDR